MANKVDYFIVMLLFRGILNTNSTPLGRVQLTTLALRQLIPQLLHEIHSISKSTIHWLFFWFLANKLRVDF